MSLLFNLTLNSDGSPNKLSGIYLKELKLCVRVSHKFWFLFTWNRRYLMKEASLNETSKQFDMKGENGESVMKLQETMHVDQ